MSKQLSRKSIAFKNTAVNVDGSPLRIGGIWCHVLKYGSESLSDVDGMWGVCLGVDWDAKQLAFS